MPATGTETARPERIPHGPAWRNAIPSVRGRRAPRTERAVDLGFALHDSVIALLCARVEGCDHSVQIGDALARIFGMAAIAIDEHGAHADGRTAFDVPAQVIADEHALCGETTELLGGMVEDDWSRLAPTDIPAQHHRVDGVGQP